MAITTAQIIRTNHNSDFFNLTVDQGNKTTNIVMKMLAPIILTKDLPRTYFMLKKYLPSVLRSKCFNHNNYSFKKEVRNTEMGHLFEHILLEYLCKQKALNGVNNPVYNGITQWDWECDSRGVFHINVDVGQKDKFTFEQALIKSIMLTNKLINSHK